MKYMNAKTKTNPNTVWQPRRLEQGERIARERITNRFPGTAAGIALRQLANLTGVRDLKLYLDGLTAMRSDQENQNRDLCLFDRPLQDSSANESAVLVAISKTPGFKAQRAVLALPLAFARQVVDLALGRRSGSDYGFLSSGEQGAFLYALDRAGGDWGAASGPSFVVRGFLADTAQVADFLQAQPTWQVTVRLEGEKDGERVTGRACLLFAAPVGPTEPRLAVRGPSPVVMGWQVKLKILVGWSSVSLNDFNNLEVEDIIVLDAGGHPDSDRDRSRAILYSGVWQRVGQWLDHRRIQLVSAEEQDVEMKMKTQKSNEVGAALEQTHGGDTKSMEVVVRVEVGEVKMTVDQASELVPGRIITLNRDVDPNVILKVGDKEIGRGELVEHDGVLAVEVTEVL
jgi:type III secretion system YscQ/HrcQ family protein